MVSISYSSSWVDFFETLKELPELWKVKSVIFKDRNKKNIAWLKLLDVYKEIDINEDIDSLKKRLANIKTCYRRELNKVEQSQRSGAGAEEKYVPNLWYFETLDFLRDQVVQVPGLSTVDLAQDESEVDLAEEAIKNAPGNCRSHNGKKSVAQHMAERNDILKEALGQLTKKNTNNKDEASVFAKGWATSYRKMSRIQKIYAKKAIEEILVLGQLDLLSLNSVNSHSSTNSTASSSTYSTSFPLHHSSRSSTPFSKQSLPSSGYENAVIPVHVSTDTYNNIQDLLSDNTFS